MKQEMRDDFTHSAFSSTTTVTAVLFFLCLLPFELLPEIPVDIDAKPFFAPLALCALLPRRMGLPIGLGVALGEGMRDLMEGYELDDPIGFFGYILGFWAASQIYAIAPRSPVVLSVGAIVCAFIQGAIEASSYLLFGAEGLAVTIQSTIGNTISHGVIFGAAPLLFLTPALRGRFEHHLGFAPRDAAPPPPLQRIETDFAPDPDAVAWMKDVSYRAPSARTLAFRGLCASVRRGERIALVSEDLAAADAAGFVLAGLAPRVVGGELAGDVKRPASVALVGRDPRDQATQARPEEEVAAVLLLDGGDPEAALAEARRLLDDVGVTECVQRKFIWTLTKDQQYRVQLAAARARAPELLLVQPPSGAGLDADTRRALDDLIEAQLAHGAVVVMDAPGGAFAVAADRTVALDARGAPAEAAETARKVRADAVSQDEDRAPGDLAEGDSEGVDVLTLQTGREGWWHRRDPRTKWLMFLGLLALIYVAPSWPWMAVMAALGLVLTLMAKPPLIWLGLAIFVQTPNILGLILLPLLGDGDTGEEFAFGLRLGLGWVAAILFGISLLSTMEIPQLVAGLRGIGLPKRFSAMIGQVFVMIYLSFTDLARLTREARAGFKSFFRRPMSVIGDLAELFVPSIISVTRRSAVMAIALNMKNYGCGVQPYAVEALKLPDRLLLVATFGALAAAAAARIGLF